MKKIIFGIDEAGRGPWAGPLVVAGIATFDEKIFQKIPLLNDSKKLSPKHRDEIFSQLKKLEQQGKIFIFTEIVSAQKIDEIGIREANRQAMQNIILRWESIKNNENSDIFIDGSDNFIFEKIIANYTFAYKKSQKKREQNSQMNVDFSWRNHITFLIGGDAKEWVISAASIIAKVTRDRLMEEYAKEFPEYEFHKHKWYGTKLHREKILYYGINFLHRKSYEPIKTLISQETWLL